MMQTVHIFRHGPQDSLGLLPQALAQLGVKTHVHDITDLSQDLPPLHALEWAMFLGCTEAAYDDTLPWLGREMAYIQALQDAQIPMFGICFGSQIIARTLGGSVQKNTDFENAWVQLNEAAQALGLPSGPWFSFHFDAFELPPQAKLLGATSLANQAYVLGKTMAVQFHPEINSDMFEGWLKIWQQSQTGQHFLELYQTEISLLKQKFVDDESIALARLVALLQAYMHMVKAETVC
ncbi:MULTISPECIES: type 1 glutamine amidotransferase [Vitreoscilla]|uniref:Type 1 glutamine amidotransferase n=1 Tax=Vitreoscilla stercoraria TaxID=61 RepID=A0ABY4ECI6_VITST|nr:MULTISPECIES: type 1 glutamine amidotransferase [Vitreoscilla]AUZ05667.2 putative class 1 glutamine amidotransferase [Vitreoscilla sp. C1]UOO92929.1 type 1 glutamine amidotransferase [Vitreoscilla stercoraria]